MFNTDTTDKQADQNHLTFAVSNIRTAIFANALAAILYPFYLKMLALNLPVHANELSCIIIYFLSGLVFGICANLYLYFTAQNRNRLSNFKKRAWIILFAASLILFMVGTWKSVQIMLSTQNQANSQAINYTPNLPPKLQRLVEVEFTISGIGQEPIHFAVLR